MRSKPLLLFLFISICCLAACKNAGNKFHVIGTISNMPAQRVTLEELGYNDVITIVDSTHSNDNGSFELDGTEPEPGLYRLHFEQNKFILLAIDKGTVKVDGNWDSLENYRVGGSAASVSLRNFLLTLRKHLREFSTMSLVLDTLQARGNDSMLAAAKQNFLDMRVKFTRIVENYADTTQYLPNAIFAAKILNARVEHDYLNGFTQGLERRFPHSKMAKDFVAYYNKNNQAQKTPAQSAAKPEIGSIAPDIELPDVNGKPLQLSALRGKYVLLDFWASWCGPCRAENPNVVAAYRKYKDKNFTVYSVSLDNDKDKWMQAIQQDGLVWPTQVSDLKGWETSAARRYDIEAIPSNFLLDPNGKILARDLRGDDLDARLAAILK